MSFSMCILLPFPVEGIYNLYWWHVHREKNSFGALFTTFSLTVQVYYVVLESSQFFLVSSSLLFSSSFCYAFQHFLLNKQKEWRGNRLTSNCVNNFIGMVHIYINIIQCSISLNIEYQSVQVEQLNEIAYLIWRRLNIKTRLVSFCTTTTTF